MDLMLVKIFFVLVIHSHIVAAAMEQLGISTLSDYPTKLTNAGSRKMMIMENF